MTLLRTTILGGCAALALAAPAAASGASFGPSGPIGLTVTGPIATSLGAGGEAAVGGLDGSRPDGTFIALATRTGAGAPWKVASLGPVCPRRRATCRSSSRAVARSSRGRRRATATITASSWRPTPRRNALRAPPLRDRQRLLRVAAAGAVEQRRRGRRVARRHVPRAGTCARGAVRRRSSRRGTWTAGRDAAQVVLAARGLSASASSGRAPTTSVPAPTRAPRGARCRGR